MAQKTPNPNKAKPLWVMRKNPSPTSEAKTLTAWLNDSKNVIDLF
jgi:hypothetical protein